MGAELREKVAARMVLLEETAEAGVAKGCGAEVRGVEAAAMVLAMEVVATVGAKKGEGCVVVVLLVVDMVVGESVEGG